MSARRAQSADLALIRCLVGATLLGIAFSASAIDAVVYPAIAAPSKKSSRKGQTIAPAQTSPDITSTTPKDEPPKTPVTTVAPRNDDDVIPPPFNLPTASRARMKACGESWQAFKMSGQAGDQTWRAYATKCLASKDPPVGDKPKTLPPP